MMTPARGTSRVARPSRKPATAPKGWSKNRSAGGSVRGAETENLGPGLSGSPLGSASLLAGARDNPSTLCSADPVLMGVPGEAR